MCPCEPGNPCLMHRKDEAPPSTDVSRVDAVARSIRSVDGNHSLGAAALAEELLDDLYLRHGLVLVDSNDVIDAHAAVEAERRIQQQWADERRVYLALAADVRRLLPDGVGDPDADEELMDEIGDIWAAIARRMEAIDKFEKEN